MIPKRSSDRLPLLAHGRDANVFDRGDGTVLRRYRHRDVPETEVKVMRYARESGYPVPDVVQVAGRDLVLERITGPTMQEALGAGSLGILDAAAQLADLHERLHRISGPDWLRQRGEGDHLLHLDLHPQNVLLGSEGLVVIDWANAARGPAALDPALAIAVFVSVRPNFDAVERVHMDEFVRAFVSHFDRAALEAALPLAIDLRAADRNVTDVERTALRGLRLDDLTA